MSETVNSYVLTTEQRNASIEAFNKASRGAFTAIVPAGTYNKDGKLTAAGLKALEALADERALTQTVAVLTAGSRFVVLGFVPMTITSSSGARANKPVDTLMAQIGILDEAGAIKNTVLYSFSRLVDVPFNPSSLNKEKWSKEAIEKITEHHTALQNDAFGFKDLTEKGSSRMNRLLEAGSLEVIAATVVTRDNPEDPANPFRNTYFRYKQI